MSAELRASSNAIRSNEEFASNRQSTTCNLPFWWLLLWFRLVMHCIFQTYFFIYELCSLSPRTAISFGSEDVVPAFSHASLDPRAVGGGDSAARICARRAIR